MVHYLTEDLFPSYVDLEILRDKDLRDLKCPTYFQTILQYRHTNWSIIRFILVKFSHFAMNVLPTGKKVSQKYGFFPKKGGFGDFLGKNLYKMSWFVFLTFGEKLPAI